MEQRNVSHAETSSWRGLYRIGGWCAPAGAPATTSPSATAPTSPGAIPPRHPARCRPPRSRSATVVTSPLTISGAALAFEGGVNVRVAQVSNGKVRQFGTGHVTGGGDVMRPFTGQIRFAAPSTDIGWVLATELSAYDGAVTKVTAVRVAFTPLGS